MSGGEITVERPGGGRGRVQLFRTRVAPRRRRVLGQLGRVMAAVALLVWGLLLWRELSPVQVLPPLRFSLEDMVPCEAGTLRRVSGPRERLIAPFYIDRVEVTQADWARFLAAHPEHPPPPGFRGARTPPVGQHDAPIVLISLKEAEAYAHWLGKRLPTVDEWVWAASREDGKYPWGAVWARQANTLELDLGGPTPVGLFQDGRSPVGAYDMLGNVREMTATRVPGMLTERIFVLGGSFRHRGRSLWSSGLFDPYVPMRRDGGTGTSPETGAGRGSGDWNFDATMGATSARAHDVGFRLVLDASTVAERRRFQELVAADLALLGREDPLSLLLTVWPAERRVLAHGEAARPVLDQALQATPEGRLKERIASLLARLDGRG